MFAVQDKVKSDIERLKLGNGQSYDRSNDKLPLWHKVRKIGMVCFSKPILRQDLYIVQKEEISITCHMCDTYT
jgi:hypothetical protein